MQGVPQPQLGTYCIRALSEHWTCCVPKAQDFAPPTVYLSSTGTVANVEVEWGQGFFKLEHAHRQKGSGCVSLKFSEAQIFKSKFTWNHHRVCLKISEPPKINQSYISTKDMFFFNLVLVGIKCCSCFGGPRFFQTHLNLRWWWSGDWSGSWEVWTPIMTMGNRNLFFSEVERSVKQ